MPSRTFLAPSLTAMIFTVISAYVLITGHPHEDAYILHIYSENLARFGEITYFEGGPAAEGATDFLWMLALAGLAALGIPAAWGGVVLNAAGLWLLAHILCQEAARRGAAAWVPLGLVLFLPAYSIAQASVAGFSAGLYAALIAALMAAILNLPSRQLAAVPLLSILIGLVRPDGVIIGVVATLACLPLIAREDRRRYFMSMAVALGIGLAYFIWRMSYFGALLPLPLYVKSASDQALAGLADNLRWVKVNVLLLGLTCWALYRAPAIRRRFIIASLGPIALFLALTFATQSQNIAMRFQAPMSVVVLMGAMVCLSGFSRRAGPWPAILITALAVVHLAYHAPRAMRLVGVLTNHDYINSFPYHLRSAVPATARIALTEAGRLAYWLEGETYDLVGLNTAETAKNGATAGYISARDPDLIFWHVAGTITPGCPNDLDHCRLSGSDLISTVEAADLPPVHEIFDRVARAPVAVYDHIRQNPNRYDLVAARYGAGWSHLYAIKRGGQIDLGAFEAALSRSFEQVGFRSYAQMRAAALQ
ncbi:hypothetical protein [Aliiroseovarius marinus]|uniref:hypothetical protein n=1 Tax=Aliiroseovarius marinus TaxID=2500159 RepID=UPI003D7DBC82